MELDARCLAHALSDEARIASTRNAGIAKLKKRATATKRAR